MLFQALYCDSLQNPEEDEDDAKIAEFEVKKSGCGISYTILIEAGTLKIWFCTLPPLIVALDRCP